MTDEHNPYRDDVYWPMDQIRKADMAAAEEDRRWEGRKIVGWSMWKAGAYWHNSGQFYVVYSQRI